MYLYYNKNGLLLEIVNPDAPHQTSVDHDKIFIFVDGYETVTNGLAIFEASDGTLSNELPITKGTPKEIPYNAKRDLKYFEYFKDYAFFEIDIPQEILQIGELTRLNFRLVLDGSFKQLDVYPFMVKNGIVNDTCITQGQYYELLSAIAHKTNDTDFRNSGLELTTTEYDEVNQLTDTIIYKGLYNGKACIFRIEKTSTKVIAHALLTSRTKENEDGLYGYELVFESGVDTIANQKTLINVLDYTTSENIKTILADLSNKIYANKLTINQSWLVQTGQRTHTLIFVNLFNGKLIEYTIVKDDTIQRAIVEWTTEQATANDVNLLTDLKQQTINAKNVLEEQIENIKNDYVAKAEKGQPNGVASLDGTGKIPTEQLPSNGIFKYKGQVPTYNDLPKDGNEIGDTWDVAENGKNYVWNGTSWDDLGGETFSQEWIDKINNNTNDIVEINNDLAHFSKDIVDLQLDKLDKKPIYLDHGTDLLIFDWNKYENGTYFAGTDFVNLPTEITEHKDVLIQLIKQNESGRYALVLYHTGVYESNTGIYVNFHYSDKFKGWEKISTSETIDIPKATATKLGGIKANATTSKDTKEVHIDSNGFLKVGVEPAGDKARVVGENLIFESAVESDTIVPNNGQPTTKTLNTLAINETNYQLPTGGSSAIIHISGSEDITQELWETISKKEQVTLELWGNYFLKNGYLGPETDPQIYEFTSSTNEGDKYLSINKNLTFELSLKEQARDLFQDITTNTLQLANSGGRPLGTGAKFKTINGNSIFKDGNIDTIPYIELNETEKTVTKEQYDILTSQDITAIKTGIQIFYKCELQENDGKTFMAFCSFDGGNVNRCSVDWIKVYKDYTLKFDRSYVASDLMSVGNKLKLAIDGGQFFGNGIDFKTINGKSVFGEGNLSVGGGGQSVIITNPPSATNGNLNQGQLEALQANDLNYIIFNNEIYSLNDKTHTADTLTYSHVGYENGKHLVKTISVTISTKAWVLNKSEIDGGTQLYLHRFNMNISYTTGNSPITEDVEFNIIDVVGKKYDFVFASIYYNDPISMSIYRTHPDAGNFVKVVNIGFNKQGDLNRFFMYAPKDENYDALELVKVTINSVNTIDVTPL